MCYKLNYCSGWNFNPVTKSKRFLSTHTWASDQSSKEKHRDVKDLDGHRAGRGWAGVSPSWNRNAWAGRQSDLNTLGLTCWRTRESLEMSCSRKGAAGPNQLLQVTRTCLHPWGLGGKGSSVPEKLPRRGWGEPLLGTKRMQIYTTVPPKGPTLGGPGQTGSTVIALHPVSCPTKWTEISL